MCIRDSHLCVFRDATKGGDTTFEYLGLDDYVGGDSNSLRFNYSSDNYKNPPLTMTTMLQTGKNITRKNPGGLFDLGGIAHQATGRILLDTSNNIDGTFIIKNALTANGHITKQGTTGDSKWANVFPVMIGDTIFIIALTAQWLSDSSGNDSWGVFGDYVYVLSSYTGPGSIKGLAFLPFNLKDGNLQQQIKDARHNNTDISKNPNPFALRSGFVPYLLDYQNKDTADFTLYNAAKKIRGGVPTPNDLLKVLNS